MLPLKARAANILVVDDDSDINEQVSNLLSEQGYRVEQCFDGQQGLVAAVSQNFDLVLLDVLLPGLDGISVLNQLRKTRQTPVMMITACGAEQERIVGYSQGADDYVPKPFNFKELLLRVEALLRRSMNNGETRADCEEVQIGDLRMHRRYQTVEIGGQEVTVTPIEFRLLWMLVIHRNEVLTKAYLYPLVLERNFSCYDRSLDMHLSRVRRKLTDAGMALDRLQTVRGKGYCFV